MKWGVIAFASILLAGCGAATPDPASAPATPVASTNAPPPPLVYHDDPPPRPPSISLQEDPGVVVDPNRRAASAPTPSAPAPADTGFFPRSHDAPMFGGCGANDFNRNCTKPGW